jgi:septal ring factor EnvC (AmiA/AmiB activator)
MVVIRKALALLLLSAVAALSFSMGYVHAYSSEIRNNLNKTRDALLDQRSHLQQRADQLTLSIQELNRQLDVVNSYLRDTDRNIRDVEDALKRVN